MSHKKPDFEFAELDKLDPALAPKIPKASHTDIGPRDWAVLLHLVHLKARFVQALYDVAIKKEQETSTMSWYI